MLVDLFPNFWDEYPRGKQFSSTNGWTVNEWELSMDPQTWGAAGVLCPSC